MGEFECAGVKCLLSGKCLVVSIYGPPLGNKDIFFNKLEQLLPFINNYEMVFIAGDINIEMLKENNHKTIYF